MKHTAPQFPLPITPDPTPAPFTLEAQPARAPQSPTETTPDLLAIPPQPAAKDQAAWLARLSPRQRNALIRREAQAREISPSAAAFLGL